MFGSSKQRIFVSYFNENKETMKLYTRLLTLAAVIGLATSTISCTPEEAALGGALIGAGAAIAIMNNNNSHYGGNRGYHNGHHGGHHNGHHGGHHGGW